MGFGSQIREQPWHIIYHFKAKNLNTTNLLTTFKWNFATCLSFCGNRSHMSPASTAVLAWKIDIRKMPLVAPRSWTHLYCVCFCVCGRQKPEDPQFEPPWLTTPLHRAVYEVWDLPCISMKYNHPRVAKWQVASLVWYKLKAGVNPEIVRHIGCCKICDLYKNILYFSGNGNESENPLFYIKFH